MVSLLKTAELGNLGIAKTVWNRAATCPNRNNNRSDSVELRSPAILVTFENRPQAALLQDWNQLLKFALSF